VSAVRDATLVVVLDEGRVVESGTHHSLIGAGGRYSALLRRQQLEESIEEDGGAAAEPATSVLAPGSGDVGR
jgi:ATP-binding cassette subfamily B protein